jgi:DNA-binding SARP family transcriptional activator
VTASRAGSRARGLLALVTLAVVVVGLPVALLRLGGSPIPARLPSFPHVLRVLARRDSGALFLGAVRDVAWLAWASFAGAVLAEAQAAMRGRQARRLSLAVLQGAAARLVAVASLTFGGPAVIVLAATPALASTVHAPARHGRTGHADDPRFSGSQRTVMVRPGDCLWTIAQRYLGAGDRYGEIVRLNLGRDVGAGELLTDPSLILPGWHLLLPNSGQPGSGRHSSSQPGSGQPNSARHSSGQHSPNKHAGHSSSDPQFASPHAAAGRRQQDPTWNAGSTPGSSAPGDHGTSGTSGVQQAPGSGHGAERDADQQDVIDQVVLFSVGMLAGSAVASLDRLRHRQRQHRRRGRRIPLPAGPESIAMERKLRAARPVAPPATLRDALTLLSDGVAANGDPLPPIAGLHLTSGTVEVLLSAPAGGPPPAPFTIAPAREAMCWTADLEWPDSRPEPPAPGEAGDLLPGLFTAGATDAGGYLLLDLEAMRVTCCDGPDELTDRLLVTAATELASSRWSSWYELVLVGCAELGALGRAEQCDDMDEALDRLASRASAVARRLRGDGHADVRTRRMEDPDDEDWGLMLLVSRVPPTREQMARLLDLTDGPGGLAALVAGDTQTEDGNLAPALFRLERDASNPGGMVAIVTLAYLGPDHHITVWPQTLTVGEYQALAGALATAADEVDVGAGDAPYDRLNEPPPLRLAAAPVWMAEADGFSRTVAGPDAGLDPAGLDPPGLDPPGLDPPGLDPVGLDPPDLIRPDRDSYQPERAWRHDAARPLLLPRHAASGIAVKTLGPLEIVGTAEPLGPQQAELVLALALNAASGLSNSALCTMLGADADHPKPADAVRQLITRTRRRLGQPAGDQDYIVHLGNGIYVPHEDVRLDWDQFRTLTAHGFGERSVRDLRAAMALVRGQPLADCYHWWIDVALVETIRAEVVDAADLLAELELATCDSQAACRAARSGLAAEPAAEQLWRALMRAEHAQGNPAGVAAAWTGCLDAIDEIAPGAAPHPDTERLYAELTGQHRLAAGLR